MAAITNDWLAAISPEFQKPYYKDLYQFVKKEYSENEAFALTKDNDETSRIYGENKLEECSVIPVILAPKKNLNI